MSSPRLVLAGILTAALLSAWTLDLSPAALVPAPGSLDLTTEVFGAMLAPALDYETADLPDDLPPFLFRVADAAGRTVWYALGALGLAVLGGLALGFLASTAWWDHDPVCAESRGGSRRARTTAWLGARALVAAMRSTHELLWAVLFLAAMGLSPLAAVVALAIPHTGVVAKVWAELLDEAPRTAADQLRAAGAGPLQRFVFGIVPCARNDLIAYGFYRFECLVRGSAVLGFFGVETIGKYVRDAFEYRNYHEMWTYVYALVGMGLALDLWSGAIRRRLA